MFSNYIVKRRSKDKFELKMAEKVKHDLKSFFSHARSESRTKHSVASLTYRNGHITNDNFEKSLILNELFSSVFTKENTNSISHPEQVFTGDTNELLFDFDVSQSHVEKKLRNLNKNNVPGVDGIHPSLLMELSKQLSGPLSILFRRTLYEGTVPADWIEANVTPLYNKKGIKVVLVIIDQ